MKKRFLVPTAVALVFHAILLFGFRRGPAVVPEIDAPVDLKPRPKDVIEVEWPVTRDDSETTPAPKGDPDAARQEPLDPPARQSPTSIPIPVDVPNPRPLDPRITVINGPWGDPNAKELFGTGGTGITTPDHLDNLPRARAQVAPVYPFEARVDGRAGEVLVEFVVDEAGRVLDPHVLRSNDPRFEAPTLQAVAKWRFEPGRKNGRVVRFRMAVPVGFAINP